MNIRSMNIGSRAGIGFTIIALLVLVMGGIALFQAYQMDDAAAEIRNEWLPAVEAVGEVGSSLGRARALTLRTLILEEKSELNTTVDLVRSINQDVAMRLKGYEKEIDDSEDRQIFEKFKTSYEKYLSVQRQILEGVLSSPERADEIKMANGPLADNADQMMVFLNQLIKFNEKGGIEAILPRTRGDAQKLIEECMLLANTCAANFALKHELPVLYRNHDKPDGEKSMRIHEYAKNFGLSFPEENPTQADYQRIIEATKDRPDAISIHSMLLRSMMQANYAPDNIGHFGLAYDEYSHFTSPIRRYPDLMLHRAIKAKVTNTQQPVMDFSLEAAGTQTSDTERRAEKASRYVESWLKCHYMKDHVGEEFEGVVTTVTSFGLFVTLTDLYIDGLVHISNVGDDFFVYDEQQQQLIGKDKGTLFGLGDRVKVKVAGVNMDLLQIDFDLKAKLQSSEMNQTKSAPSKKSTDKKSTDRRSPAKKTGSRSKGASKKS